MGRQFYKKARFSKIKPAVTNNTMCGVIIKISEDTELDLVKQLILGDILENKIPDEKLFLK